MIKFSREQAQVLAKLSSYFKVPRADLREDAFTASGQDDSLLRSSTLVELGFNRWLRCVPGACFGLRHMVDWSKFERSKLYAEFILGEGMLVGNDVRSYMMALYSQGTCWVVYRTLTSYRGVGGWYLAQPETEYGVVAEPLVNWLQHNCPWLDT